MSVLTDDDAELQASTWRVERGALWDAAPHALSPLVAVLGPVESVAAVAGAGRVTALILRHESGVCSQVETTLEAPPAATAWTVTVHGESGVVSVPHDLEHADRYLAAAVTLLRRRAAGEDVPGGVDIAFARHLLGVVAAAERSIASGRMERVS